MCGPGSAISVLHVDDEPSLAELTADILQQQDDALVVETVSGTTEALAHLSDADVDCIVSDYDMPGRNGIELLEAVRAEHLDLPFILFTGKGSEAVASDAISAGATDYLQKASGTEQFELLANRIRNAVEQYRAAARADELDRIRTLTSDITQELVRADTRSVAEARVCDLISDADPYVFAWIGEVDTETGRVDPRTAAGIGEDYLDEITVAVDDDPEGQGPCGTAIRERRVAVSQDIDTDPDFEPWRADALERGYRAAAAVPIEYAETLYGVLVVYVDHVNPFDETERALLAELGTDIGHAFYSFEMQARLREERDRRRALFVNAPTPVVANESREGDDEPVVADVNEAFVDVFGYDPEDVVGEDIAEVVVPPDGAGRHQTLRERVTSGTATIAEVERVTADGTREFLLHSVPYGSDDRTDGWYTWYTDISEQKDNEKQLALERDRLEALFESIPEPAVDVEFTDRGTILRNVNEAFEDTFGYAASAVVGEDINDVIVPEAATASAREIDQLATDGEQLTRQITRETRDGTREFLFRSAPVDHDAETTRQFGVYIDITDRIERERAIEALHSTAREFMTATTREDVADLTAEAARDTLGLPINGVFLHDEAEDCLVPVAWTETATSLIGELPTFEPGDSLAWEVFESGRTQTHTDVSTVPGRHNPDTPVRSEVILPLGDHGVLVAGSGDVGAFSETDVSLARILTAHARSALDRVEREQELARHNERLEAFTDTVGHDLRSPLNVATTRLELAQSDSDSPNLEAVAQALDRTTTLLADLQTFARVGESAIEPETVDIASLCETAWQHVETRAATLVTDTQHTVRADRSRLQELLENLFRNAVEHGSTGSQNAPRSDDAVEHSSPDSQMESDGAFDKGSETVTVTVGDLPDGFYVADDGPGIPSQDRDRIFEHGYSTGDDGTGFGLSIVREIAEAHGWTVTVTDSAEGGARFEVTDVDR